MFEGQKIEIYSDYAKMVELLCVPNDRKDLKPEIQFPFATIFDLFITGAIVGAINGKRERPNDRKVKKTMFDGVISNNSSRIEFVTRSIILSSISMTKEEKTIRAFKEFSTNKEVVKKNEQMLIEYANAGIRIIYNDYMEVMGNGDSKEEYIISFIDKYKNTLTNSDIMSKILKLARKDKA